MSQILEVILVLGIVAVAAYFVLNGLPDLGLAPPPGGLEEPIVEEGAEADPSAPVDEIQEAVDTSGEDIPDDDQLLQPPMIVGVPYPEPVPYFIYDERDDNRRERCKCKHYNKKRLRCEAKRRRGRCICECKRRNKKKVKWVPPRVEEHRNGRRDRGGTPTPTAPSPSPSPKPRWPPSGQTVPKTVPTTPAEEDAKNKMAGFLSGDALYSEPGIIKFSGMR
jgi:hypothetical protein